MDWVDVATAVALTGSGVGPGILAVLAWRLLERVREEQESVLGIVSDLRANAQELASGARQVSEAASRIASEPSGAGTAATITPDASSGAMQGAPRQLLEDQGKLITAIAELEQGGFREWRERNREELQRVRALEARWRSELEASRDRAGELEDQGRRERQGAHRELRELRTQVDQLTNALAAATEESRRHASRANALAGQIETRQGSVTVPELQARLQRTEADASRLACELEAMKAHLGRILTEKEFIEERFVQWSAERGGPT